MDAQLPTSLNTLNRIFRSSWVIDPCKLAGALDKVQWRYAAPCFDLGVSYDFDKNIIVPIPRKILMNIENERIWEIEVLEDFVCPKLRGVVSHSRLGRPEDHLGTVS